MTKPFISFPRHLKDILYQRANTNGETEKEKEKGAETEGIGERSWVGADSLVSLSSDGMHRANGTEKGKEKEKEKEREDQKDALLFAKEGDGQDQDDEEEQIFWRINCHRFNMHFRHEVLSPSPPSFHLLGSNRSDYSFYI